MKKTLLTISFFLALAAYGYAQDSSSQGSSSQGSGSQGSSPSAPEKSSDATSDAPAPPEPGTAFGDAFGRGNLTAVFTFRQEYDDNALSSATLRFSDNISRLGGRISYSSRASRHTFELHYAPDYRIYAKFDDLNGLSQVFGQAWTYRMAPHTTLRLNTTLSDTSSRSNTAYTFINVNNQLVPVFNPQGVTNGIRVLTSFLNMTIEHRQSARSTFRAGIGGGTVNFFELNGVSPSATQADQHFNTSAMAGWNYAVRKDVRFGFEAGYQYFGFVDPSSHQHHQYAKATYEQDFKNGVRFRVAAGPSFTESSTSSNYETGVDVDASVHRAFRRTMVGGSYQHGQHLGYAQGATGTDLGSLFVNQTLRKRWDMGGSFSYSRTQGLGGSGTLDSYGVNTNVGYRLTRVLRLGASYFYTNQTSASGTLTSSAFDKSVYAIFLNYNIGSPSGR